MDSFSVEPKCVSLLLVFGCTVRQFVLIFVGDTLWLVAEEWNYILFTSHLALVDTLAVSIRTLNTTTSCLHLSFRVIL